MHLIVCLDDNNGMAFNHRRQTRDRELIRKMLDTVNGNPIWMSPYSYKMFLDAPEGAVIPNENYLEEAGEGDFCFAELENLEEIMHKVKSLIIFRWNRVYPADTWLPVDLSSWRKYFSEDFEGSSHEKITKEMYVKNDENNE